MRDKGKRGAVGGIGVIDWVGDYQERLREC